MKRINNLFVDEKLTVNLCRMAILESSSGKRHRRDVQKIMNNIDYYAEQLQNMLLDMTFQPSKYGYETKIEYGKKRNLQKPKFYPDQCVHHVMIMLIRDKSLKRIDPHAIASVDKRGAIMGIKCLKYWIQKRNKRETTYCGKGDIRHCFDSITPEVAYSTFTSFIKDVKYLEIMRRIIFSFTSLPLGNYISGWVLNLLLKRFDDNIRACDGVTHYLRYMDDFVFFSSNRRKAKKVREVAIAELDKIGLKLKENYQLFKVDDRGVDMLGYRFFRNYVILRKRNLKKILRSAKNINKRHDYSPHNCMSFMSRLGQAKHCSSKYVFKHVGKQVNLQRAKDVIRDYFRKKAEGHELFISKNS